MLCFCYSYKFNLTFLSFSSVGCMAACGNLLSMVPMGCRGTACFSMVHSIGCRELLLCAWSTSALFLHWSWWLQGCFSHIYLYFLTLCSFLSFLKYIIMEVQLMSLMSQFCPVMIPFWNWLELSLISQFLDNSCRALPYRPTTTKILTC